ncbi:hypothetical protein OIO90_003808 [Microbotryomycetes sp. JL221]|nr:hypothetical protein OIO90_003808 [Microbotryomycetes sp. JL221]
MAPVTFSEKAPASTASSTATGTSSSTPLHQPQPHQQGQQQQQTQVGPHAPSTVFPALHLIPLNDTFVPKQISLIPPGVRVKIGRQTNAKTIPNGSNGYFDSKVLSRMHAEVWSEDNKVLIKDVKSSNGTFIDGLRLSPEAAESDVFELRTGSTVEFGIDIVSDDSKTVVHHKVSAKVIVVMNADDALFSSREFNAWYRQAGEQANQRRNRNVGGGTQANGLSFEHVFNRLQGELQKSRDTSSHLGDLTSALNDVHETLGGAPPPANFHQRGLPPYLANGHSPAGNQQQQQQQNDTNNSHAQSIAALQAQLNETQSNLQTHVGKIRELETLLAEQDVIKQEVNVLRAQMEDAKRGMDHIMTNRYPDDRRARETDGRESPVAKLLESREDEDEHDDTTRRQSAYDDDDDDARSVSSVETISPSNFGSSRSDGSATLVDNAARLFGVSDHSSTTRGPSFDEAVDGAQNRENQLREQNFALSARLDALSSQLDEATKLGQTLLSQHAQATETIKALENRVQGLEKAVETKVNDVESKVLQEVEGRWSSWRETFEESVRKERAGWREEREQLMRIVRQWEQNRRHDSGSTSEEDDGDEAAMAGDVGLATRGKKSRRSRSKRRHKSIDTVTTDDDGVDDNTDSLADRPSSVDLPPTKPERDTSKQSRGTNRTTSSGHGKLAASPIPIQYASAGAVVLLSVAAAWAVSVKLKE